MLIITFTKHELLLAFGARGDKGPIASLLDDLLLEQILHELAGIPTFNDLALHLLKLKFQLVDLRLLGPHDVELVQLGSPGLLYLALGAPFLGIHLEEVCTYTSCLYTNNRSQAHYWNEKTYKIPS